MTSTSLLYTDLNMSLLLVKSLRVNFDKTSLRNRVMNALNGSSVEQRSASFLICSSSSLEASLLSAFPRLVDFFILSDPALFILGLLFFSDPPEVFVFSDVTFVSLTTVARGKSEENIFFLTESWLSCGQ